MKLAITGCNGDVGKRIMKLALRRGHTVLAIDLADSPAIDGLQLTAQELERLTYNRIDLTNYADTLDALASAGSEGVIQLAAHRSPGDYGVTTHNANVVISWNVLRAAAELSINRVAQASSVNIITMVYSQKCDFKYFPIDEMHPCLPDEPYGLSKLICEMQADTLVRRYPMRIASLRLHWSIPDPTRPSRINPDRKSDLWGYVQEDSAADAFLRAVVDDNGKWSGHESFFIASPRNAYWERKSEYVVTAEELKEKYWPEVPIKEGFDLRGDKGFFDCSKAERLLGWVHSDSG